MSEVNQKKKRLKPSDPDFVAPDGGWAWIVAFACGFSNFWIFTMFQQYGLMFLDEFERIGITHSQTTTIFNINASLTAFIGLFNGPIYRRFSFRQVALFGTSMVVLSLLIVMWCKSFLGFCIFYGIIYGTAIGIAQTGNAVALNTYFKKKRSTATGISWGITGAGSIACPYIVNFLLNKYGLPGTLLLFSGFAGHSVMCSLLLQPVHWHTKYKEQPSIEPTNQKDVIVKSNSMPNFRNISDEFIIDSQPFQYIDSSTLSINGTIEDNENIKNGINANHKPIHNYAPQQSNFQSEPFLRNSKSTNQCSSLTQGNGFFKDLGRKIVDIFDLDLLKDMVYLNIIFGMTIICFAEFNFAIMIPMIFKEFNFERYQIAAYLSITGAVDTLVRFFFPQIANKIRLNSRIYFLLGTSLTTIARIILIHTQDFTISLMVAVIYGFGKGLCVIYMALLIPNHVPLRKLPAAIGIYMSTFAMFLMALAPAVGKYRGFVRDVTKSYVITLHILNVFVYIAIAAWFTEYIFKKTKQVVVEKAVRNEYLGST